MRFERGRRRGPCRRSSRGCRYGASARRTGAAGPRCGAARRRCAGAAAGGAGRTGRGRSRIPTASTIPERDVGRPGRERPADSRGDQHRRLPGRREEPPLRDRQHLVAGPLARDLACGPRRMRRVRRGRGRRGQRGETPFPRRPERRDRGTVHRPQQQAGGESPGTGTARNGPTARTARLLDREEHERRRHRARPTTMTLVAASGIPAATVRSSGRRACPTQADGCVGPGWRRHGASPVGTSRPGEQHRQADQAPSAEPASRRREPTPAETRPKVKTRRGVHGAAVVRGAGGRARHGSYPVPSPGRPRRPRPVRLVGARSRAGRAPRAPCSGRPPDRRDGGRRARPASSGRRPTGTTDHQEERPVSRRPWRSGRPAAGWTGSRGTRSHCRSTSPPVPAGSAGHEEEPGKR